MPFLINIEKSDFLPYLSLKTEVMSLQISEIVYIIKKIMLQAKKC